MPQCVNMSEEFVFKACRKSFLKLWSYANPLRKHAGKELCDVLVVCDPHIIIVSVKDVNFKDTGNTDVDLTRWHDRAIESSVKQLYGAERHLRTATRVVRSDGTDGLPFPQQVDRIFHRLAIACGGHGEVPIPSGDFGKGYVHVMTEESFWTIIRELDTVTDLTGYLAAKEDTDLVIDILGTEADLLAFYLTRGRTFPKNVHSLLITDDIWEGYVARPEVSKKKEADHISYSWDRLINIIATDVIEETIEPAGSSSATELALRAMAREDRFSRRILGQALRGLLENPGLRARVTKSPSGVTYMLMQANCDASREKIFAELEGRSFLARGMFPENHTVIGIAILTDTINHQQSIMLCRLYIPEWTSRNQQDFEAIQAATGGFRNVQQQVSQVDEYPAITND